MQHCARLKEVARNRPAQIAESAVFGAELETQLEIGARVEIIPLDHAHVLIRDAQEVGRMLLPNGLAQAES